VPASEVGDPDDLRLVTRLNGEVMQDASTSLMLFSVPKIVAELSRGMTLLPGTVILTGTPAGVGAGRTPPRFLRDGDVVEIEIERIGTLRNPVREAS
jgi:2,4-didehydro-3-deoxy-L-rhamnonate hydrolase